MKVVDFLSPEAVIPALAGATKGEVLAEMSAFLAEQYNSHLPQGSHEIQSDALLRLLEERELLASTAIGDGIAIHHGKLASVDHLVGALGRSPAGLPFDSFDGQPTHLVFMLVAPADAAGLHLKALARLSRLFREVDFRRKLLSAPDRATMYQVIADEDARS